MKIHVYNRQKDLKLNKSSVKTLVQAIFKHLQLEDKEIALYFVTSEKISALHDQFFQDPTPTDCISFPLDDEHLGEIFVCPATALSYATRRRLDPYTETALYIVHGVLHLLGFDDLEPTKRRTMRKKEKSCMRYLISQKVTLQPT